MANKKDIGNAYKEQLDAYKVSPHNRVWDRIEVELDKKDNKRVSYWKFSTSALLLLLLVSSLFYFYQNNDKKLSNDHSIEEVSLENNDSNSSHKNNNTLKEKANSDQVNSNNDLTKGSTASVDKNKTSITKNTNHSQTKNNQKHTTIGNNRSTSPHNNQVDSNNNYNITDLERYALIDMLPLTYSALIDIPRVEKDKKKRKKKSLEKFHIKATAGFNHFGSLKKGSAIDETLNSNSRKSDITFNYGVALVYDLSEHSSISFGVQRTQLSSTTRAADSTNFDSSLKFSPGFQNIDLNSTSNSYPSLSALSEIDFKQQLTYLEFPFQYYYTPSKSDLQWTFFGGVSFLTLIDNDITAESSNGNTLEIGKANNLSKISLSLNIGSGLNYVITEKLKLHVEPTFKYYINPYERNSNVSPYSINLNFGMSYKF